MLEEDLQKEVENLKQTLEKEFEKHSGLYGR